MKNQEIEDLLKVYKYRFLSFLRDKEVYPNIKWIDDDGDEKIKKEIISVFEANNTISDKKLFLSKQSHENDIELEFKMKIIAETEFFIKKVLTLKGKIFYNNDEPQELKVIINKIKINYFGEYKNKKTDLIYEYVHKQSTTTKYNIPENNNEEDKENTSLIELFNISEQLKIKLNENK